MEDGRRYSAAPSAKKRAAWLAVQAEFPELSEKRCQAIVKSWDKNKVFEVGECMDPVERRMVSGILSATLIGKISEDD
jgi:hypothetical protein